MVFQGAVWGPTLWNVFFPDSRPAIEASGTDELKYADDMTATNEFELNVPHDLIFAELHRTQTAAHEWGKLNQVIFDNAKEEFAVLHPVFGQGDAFRFLGPWIDPKLTMDVAERKLLSKAKPKVMTLLQLRSYYSKREMFAQFKTHVLPLLECAGGAIYHAASPLLDQLAHVQHIFC